MTTATVWVRCDGSDPQASSATIPEVDKHSYPKAVRHPGPLLDIARVRVAERIGLPVGDRELADELGVSMRTVLRWRHDPDAVVRLHIADRCANALGLHLAEIWPEVAQAEMEASAAERRAKKAATMRLWRQRNPGYQRRYRSDPQNAEANRRARRRAYQINSEYEKARQRAYQARRREVA